MYTECSTVQSLDFNVRHVSSDVGVSEKSGSTPQIREQMSGPEIS